MEISFFEILANFDVVFISEEVKIEKIGDNIGERVTQELFKYQIRFSIPLLVAEVCTVKETPLFKDFWLMFCIIGPLEEAEIFRNTSKRRYLIPFPSFKISSR